MANSTILTPFRKKNLHLELVVPKYIGETTWNNPAPCNPPVFPTLAIEKTTISYYFKVTWHFCPTMKSLKSPPSPNPISNLQIPHVNLHLALQAWRAWNFSLSNFQPWGLGDVTIKIYTRRKSKRTEYRTHIRWTNGGFIQNSWLGKIGCSVFQVKLVEI